MAPVSGRPLPLVRDHNSTSTSLLHTPEKESTEGKSRVSIGSRRMGGDIVYPGRSMSRAQGKRRRQLVRLKSGPGLPTAP